MKYLLSFDSQMAEVVYSNLFSLYQNGSDIEKVFVLHFVPALVWEYLVVSSNHEKVVSHYDNMH